MEFTTPRRKCLLVSCPCEPGFCKPVDQAPACATPGSQSSGPGPTSVPGQSDSCTRCLPLRVHAALCGQATPMPPGLGCTHLCIFHFLQIYQTAWTTPALTCRRPASPPSAAPAASPSGSSVPGPLSSGVGGSAAQLKAVVCLCPTAVGLFSMMFSRWPCSPAAWLGAACPGGCCRAGCLAAGRRRPPQHMPPPELSNAMPAMIPCLAWPQLCCAATAADPAPGGGAACSPAQPPCS